MHLQKILIDTDVLIDFLRKKDAAKRVLESALQSGDLYLSVITVAELFAGMRSAEAKTTEELIAGFTLISVDDSIARRAGELRRRHPTVLLPDCLIAASALQEECLLLTGNRKDYPFEGLSFFLP